MFDNNMKTCFWMDGVDETTLLHLQKKSWIYQITKNIYLYPTFTLSGICV